MKMKIGLDKYTHFFAGISIAASVSLPIDDIIALIVVILFAVGKEAYGKFFKKKAFDKVDMFATILGGFVWIMYSGVLQRLNWINY